MKPDDDLIGFKKFVGHGRRFDPEIIIRKNGQICFNAGAVNKHDLALFKYAILYMSESNKRCAVKFTNNNTDPAAITIQSRPGSFGISCRSFLNRYDIDFSETYKAQFVWMDRSKIAFFNIKDLVAT